MSVKAKKEEVAPPIVASPPADEKKIEGQKYSTFSTGQQALLFGVCCLVNGKLGATICTVVAVNYLRKKQVVWSFGTKLVGCSGFFSHSIHLVTTKTKSVASKFFSYSCMIPHAITAATIASSYFYPIPGITPKVNIGVTSLCFALYGLASYIKNKEKDNKSRFALRNWVISVAPAILFGSHMPYSIGNGIARGLGMLLVSSGLLEMNKWGVRFIANKEKAEKRE